MDIQKIVILAVLLIAVVLIAILVVKAIKTKNFDVIRKVAYFLVVQAEEKFGNGTGHIKYVWVVEQLQRLLPAWATRFITAEDIDKAIELGVAKLKELLSEANVVEKQKEQLTSQSIS